METQVTETPYTPVAAETDERVTPQGRKALVASVAGYAMDGFDMLILGFVLVPLSADLGLTSTEAGSLITWTLAGAVAGGMIFGIVSDYLGRVRVLSWTILLFSVFTGLCALAQGYWDLLAYRTLAGFGLGGEFGIGMALAAEAWPASKRARVSSYVAIGWQLGVLAAALLTPLLLPLIGWRGMFALGLLPAIASYFIRKRTEEPEIFVKRKFDIKSVPLRLLVKDRATTRVSAGIVVLCSIQNFGYYGMMVWMPTYLARTFGYGLTQSSLWTAATVVGMVIGIWSFGHLADRIGRKPSFLIYQAGSAVMVYVYSQLQSPETLLIGGAIMGVFVNGMVGGYGALISESFPTEVRATAQNVLFNIGRAVGGLGPLVVGGLAAHYGFSAAIALLALIYVLDIVATLVLVPELKGVELT